MLRREFIAVLGGAVAARPLAAHAQKSSPRIGWLVFRDAKLDPIDQSLKDALAQAGLIDGRNIEIVFRFANGRSINIEHLTALLMMKPSAGRAPAEGEEMTKPPTKSERATHYSDRARSRLRVRIAGGVFLEPFQPRSSSLLKNLKIESFSYSDRSLLGRRGGVGCNF